MVRDVRVKECAKIVTKKIAAWIFIVAAALCVVVTVWFLANPKGYGPTVGNPQMLEVPGVEWLATPDEVKKALNITDEQIFTENTTSGYVLEMCVTDLTLYGRDVVYAKFNFWFGTDGDTELQEVLLYFSENTDMRKLEKELLDIYGPGKSQFDIQSLYENSINRVKRSSPDMFPLETSAQNEIAYNAHDGNPFQDALDDPDYMIKHWVTENGLSIIPEEVVEYFKSVEDDEIPQDEDALMAMLDQIPWVSITMSNRNATTIHWNALGRPNELYTKNYMRFDAKLLAEYIHASAE
jgi:hypothetical protein